MPDPEVIIRPIPPIPTHVQLADPTAEIGNPLQPDNRELVSIYRYQDPTTGTWLEQVTSHPCPDGTCAC